MRHLLYIIAFWFMAGCSSSPNTVYTDAPKVEQVHPVRQHQLVVPDTLTWSAVSINNTTHFALTLDDQVALFKFMESVIIYKKESEEMLCFYGNPTECEKVNKLKDVKNDQP